MANNNKAFKIAMLTYKAAIEEIATIQQRMVLRHGLVTMFMSRALPVREFYRSTLPSRQTSMSKAAEMCASESEVDKARLDFLYDLVDEMEAIFAKYHDAEDKAWAEGFAEYVRSNYGSTPKK